jgi:hypothetical protein
MIEKSSPGAMLTGDEAQLAFDYFDLAFFNGMLKAWAVRLGPVDGGGDRGAEVDPARQTVTLDLQEIDDQGEDVFEVLTYSMARAAVAEMDDGDGRLFRNLLRKLYQAGAPVDPDDFNHTLEYEPAPAEPLGL